MFFLISSTVLFVGLSGVIGLIAYKIIHEDSEHAKWGEEGAVADAFSVFLRRKLDRIFVHTRTRHIPALLERTMEMYHATMEIASKRYADFRVSVEGRRAIKQKGAASFFLKSVIEHKKKFRDND